MKLIQKWDQSECGLGAFQLEKPIDTSKPNDSLIELVRNGVCLFKMTPDGDFLVRKNGSLKSISHAELLNRVLRD